MRDAPRDSASATAAVANAAVPSAVDKLRRQLADMQPSPSRAVEVVSGSPPPQGSTAEREAWMAELTKAKAACLRLLTASARPRANLQQALTRKGFEPDVIAAALDRLTEVGLIDDLAYARAYASTKQRERGLARRAVQSELRHRGLDDQVVADATTGIDADSEVARAIELIDKRLPALARFDRDTVRRRLLALLARRGYPADVSFRVVDDALNGQR